MKLQTPPKAAFWTFLMVGPAISVATFVVSAFWSNLTGLKSASQFIGIFISPLVGFFLGAGVTVRDLSGAFLVAALAAAASAKACGRLSIWLLLPLFPICGIIVFLQLLSPLQPFNDGEAGPHAPHRLALDLFVYHVLPGLAGSWLWLEIGQLRKATPNHRS